MREAKIKERKMEIQPRECPHGTYSDALRSTMTQFTVQFGCLDKVAVHDQTLSNVHYTAKHSLAELSVLPAGGDHVLDGTRTNKQARLTK